MHFRDLTAMFVACVEVSNIKPAEAEQQSRTQFEMILTISIISFICYTYRVFNARYFTSKLDFRQQ